LAQENLYASMIADGFHLPDSVLGVFAKSKGEKALLISDGMTYTGMEPGLYNSSATGKVRLSPEGKLHQEGKPGTLAGSASTLLKGVQLMSSMVGYGKAWEMGSVGPAHLMNLEISKGLSVGAPAKLVLLEPDLSHLAIRSVNYK
jgi:N-acetylglucosamine-6-phosphate deacetylase